MLKFGGAQKPSSSGAAGGGAANGSSSNGLATANSALPIVPGANPAAMMPVDMAAASSEDKDQQRARAYRNTGGPVAQWVGQTATMPPERSVQPAASNPPAPTRPSFSHPTNPLPTSSAWVNSRSRAARTQQ